MKVVLAAFGTYGDVHPIVDTAEAIRSLGHEAFFILNPASAHMARERGIPVTESGEFLSVNPFLKANPEVLTMRGAGKTRCTDRLH